MSDAAKKVKSLFSSKLGKPPAPEEAVGNLEVAAPVMPERPSEPMVQINVRVRASRKKSVRLMAARDNLNISDLIERALDLYEEKYGRPNL